MELRHGGFRRTVIHESCCWDASGLCLKVLLTDRDGEVEEEQGNEEVEEEYKSTSPTVIAHKLEPLQLDIALDVLKLNLPVSEAVEEWCRRGRGVRWNEVREGVDGHGNTALHWAAFKVRREERSERERNGDGRC